MPPLEWWIPQLPRVLCATLSILFFQTRSTKVRQPKDPLVIHVLLWLLASLPSSQRIETGYELEILLHATFFAIVLGTLIPPSSSAAATASPRYSTTQPDEAIRRYSALALCCPRQNERFYGDNRNVPRASRVSLLGGGLGFFLTRLPICLWVSLLLAYFEHGHTNATGIDLLYRYMGISGAVLVLISLGGAWIQQYHASADKRRQYLPVTCSVAEERHWYSWTVPQVAEWLSRFDRDLADLATREAVDGQALDFLDLETLRDMGIRYGMACKVMDAKAQLLKRYPRPGSLPASNDSSIDDAEFSTLNDRAVARQNLAFLDDDEMEQARSNMMQRFGFHLPELRKDKRGEEVRSEPEQPQQVTGKIPDTATDEALLSAMPPHIQEIVREKPYLWRQVRAMQEEHKDSSGTVRVEDNERRATMPKIENTALQTSGENIIPDAILKTLPANVREAAERNPQVFLKMYNSKQKPPAGQSGLAKEAMAPSKEAPSVDIHATQQDDEVSDETLELIPKPPSSLRIRPGF